ncbi:MAG: ABC transporter ATP-binding protein, partial [Candidatus Thioglobus sp.]
MELWGKRGDIAKTLSGGMKRRLMLARALIHQPKILILDEPTAGVDVEIRRSMWVFLQELNRQGMSIILTTHYLEEAESLCRNIAIVDNGKIIKQTNMRDLLAQIPRQILILESSKKLGKIPTGLEFSITKLDEYSLEASVSSGVNITQVLQILSENGIEIKYVKSAQNRLETLFLDLIEDK